MKKETNTNIARFLKQHSWNVSNAVQAYSAYLKWRAEKKVDNVHDSVPNKMDTITKLVSYAYCGFDREGRPIYWEKTGKSHAQAIMANVTVEEFVETHVWGFETMVKRAKESGEKNGRVIETFTTVLDFDGLGFMHSAAIPILKACQDLDTTYYPERVSKIIMINPPWMLPALYKMVRFLITDSLKQKIEIVNGDYRQELLKWIPKESIPEEYGGDVKNAFPVVSEEELANLTAGKENADEGLEKENIPAGYKSEKTVECDAQGGNFTWFFESEGSYDVDFSVVIESDAHPKDQVNYIVPPSRKVANKGSYVSQGACKLTFVWDNSYSYFNSKDIKYFVSVGPKVELTEVSN